ncbi:MAG: response regulator transcription factor [Betaproteobacteria bacterium]|nr:response regulator transcription factor [Betaproteobacteria bacterium]
MNLVRKTLRVLIVDDEAPARSRMRDLLDECGSEVPLVIAGEAASGQAALDLVSREGADVVLLDVRMPGMDGIEVAQHLQQLEHPPAVVFATAYDAYAIRAFEVQAVDYLLKPIRLARLKEALARATRPRAEALRGLARAPRTHLATHERGRIHLIPVADVIYLKAELKYVSVRTAAREHLIEESLTKLEEEFGDRFVRVHRNCLVARAAVRGFERAMQSGEAHWEVLLNGVDERIAVSRRQQHVVREFSR